MDIYLFKNSDPVNQRVKDVTSVSALATRVKIENATFLTANDRKNPQFRVQTTTDLTVYNYVEIPFYGRYYFATVVNVAVNLYLVTCHVDVLMCCADQIKSMKATVKRSATNGSSYMYDDLYKTQAFKKYVCKEFPSGLNDSSFILMTVGNTVNP